MRTVHIFPALAHQSLLSRGQFSDTGYISICDGNEVNIYDEKTANITVSEKAALKGCRCPTTKLWRIPLQDSVSNANTDTLLLNGPTGKKSLNALYSVPSTTATIHHIACSTAADRPSSLDTINNVYELPSIERAVRYLHGAVVFSPKETWLKHIRNGHYLTWPHITVKNVNKHFPESEESQKGHMRNVRQGVRSTKTLPTAPLTITPHMPLLSPKYIFISVYDPRATIFTDQTDKFPLRSSRGNH